MSCSPCSKNAFPLCLGCLDRRLPAQLHAGRYFLTLRVIPVRRLHTQNAFRDSSAQSHHIRSHSINDHVPFVDDHRNGPLLKPNGHSIEQNKEPSGLGAVGQQIKDLQEHVASIVMPPDGLSGGESSSRKGSRSTPARLARRERRMPKRRFDGDRTRPEMKRASSLEAAKSITGRSAQQDEFPRKSGEKRSSTRKIGTKSENNNTIHVEAMKEQRVKKPRWAKTADGLSEKHTSVARTSISTEESTVEDEQPTHQREHWAIQKNALKEKFGEAGWQPRKRLSPDALDGIRNLHAQYPETYSTPVLAQHFKVSPEAVRRILKSKWTPNEEEEEKRQRRWEKRGEKIWTEMSSQGLKPPKQWRQKGIGRLSERDRNRRYRPLAALEEKIGTESKQVVITTRVAAAIPEPHRPLAQKIF